MQNEEQIKVYTNPNNSSVVLEASNNTKICIKDKNELIKALGGYTEVSGVTMDDLNKVEEEASEIIGEYMEQISEGIMNAVDKVNLRLAHIKEFDLNSQKAAGMQEALNIFVKELNKIELN